MPPVKKTAKAAQAPKEMNSVLRLILSLNSNKNSLDFGINENCRIIKIDNTERKREGEVIRKNTFITFAKYNKNNEIIGQNEFSYFNFDSNSEHVAENFVSQLSQMFHIVELLNPDKISEFNPTDGIKDENELNKILTTQKLASALQAKMFEQFESVLSEVVGDNCPLLAVKIVTEKTGQYLNLPRDAKFCALMSEDYSFLKVSAYELKLKQKSLEARTETPDNKSQSSAEKSKKSIMNI